MTAPRRSGVGTAPGIASSRRWVRGGILGDRGFDLTVAPSDVANDSN